MCSIQRTARTRRSPALGIPLNHLVIRYFETLMIKHIHMLFVALSLISFTGRIIVSEINPSLLAQKWPKIAPHVIDTLLLLSGILLVFIGSWLSADYGWIVAKIIALLGYIGLGVMAMRSRGKNRWLAFAGALLCFVYIALVALKKQAFFFL